MQKLKLEEEMGATERGINQHRASKSMDIEQQRRVSEAKKEEEQANAVRRKSQVMSIKQCFKKCHGQR